MATLAEAPRVVIHPDIREKFPEPFNVIESELAGEVQFAVVKPDTYTDKSPKLLIPDVPPGTAVAVIPGFISGKHAETMLVALTKVGHTLSYKHPADARTPRADHIHYLLFDGEGRGNKPTISCTGDYISDSELHYAFYIADMLRSVGHADRVTILDPHDEVSVAALDAEVTTISALPEIADVMRKEKWIDRETGAVIVDDGAIGRTMFFAEQAEIPVVTRIVKCRINGKPTIQTIYGAEHIAGRRIILIDDMIATGGTLFTDGKKLRELGATSIIAAVTHVKGVEGAREMVSQKLNGDSVQILDHILITNSTPYYTDLVGIPRVHIVNVYPIFVAAIRSAVHQTEEYTKALDRYIYPLTSHVENLRKLHDRFPLLAPDYGVVTQSQV